MSLFELLIFFVAFCIAVLFFSKFYLVKISSVFNSNLLVFFQLIVQSLLPIGLIFFGYRYDLPHFVYDNAESLSLSFYFTIYAIFIFLTTTFLFFSIQKTTYSQIEKSYCKKNFVSYIDTNSLFTTIFFISMLFILVLLFEFRNTPLFNFIKAYNLNRDAVVLGRSEYSLSGSVNVVIKNTFTAILLVLSFFCVTRALLTKKRKWLILFFVNFIVALLLQGSSGAKAPMAASFIPLIFILYYYNYEKRKHYTKICNIILLLSLIVIILFYNIAGYGIRLSNFFALNNLGGRFLFGQITGLSSYFTIFPRYYDYLYFSSLPFMRFFGHELATSARIVMIHNYPGIHVFSTSFGVNNTLFIGDAYANLGFFGAFLSPVMVAIVYNSVLMVFLKGIKDELSLSLFVYLAFQLAWNITGGFVSVYIVNTHLIMICMFVYLLKLSLNTFFKKRNFSGS